MKETFGGYEDDSAADSGVETDAETQKIRALNDAFRRTFSGGRILITPGVQALPEPVMVQAMEAIRRFDAFTEDNDPWGLHDFGEVEILGEDGQTHKVWFKLDCYDQNLEFGSPDPSDPRVTTRVMTILLPSEY